MTKIYDNRPKYGIYVYSEGQGKHATLNIVEHNNYSRVEDINIVASELDAFVDAFNKAVEDFKRRLAIEADDED